MQIYGLLLGILGVWRITHLLNAEDGPFELFVHLRRRAGQGFWGELLDCFYCLSLWVAIPFAIAIGGLWRERLLLWFALSGGAALLERATAAKHGSQSVPYLEGSEEAQDGMLREEAKPAESHAEPGGRSDSKG
jgi:hypothetical protein